VRAVANVIQFKIYWAEVRSCLVGANELYYFMLCSKLLELCAVLGPVLLSSQHLANSVQWEVTDSVMETCVFDRTYMFSSRGYFADKYLTHTVKVKTFLV
jgi:hypothetical protein